MLLLGARTGLSDGLRLYGLIELMVGGSALLTVAADLLPADLWGTFPYRLADGIWVQTAFYQIGQISIAVICLLTPCLFMGATFPLLCDTFRSSAEGGRFPASLYAWNTLGACCGVLACQFVLILTLGHEPTFWLMAGLNILLGCYFLRTGGAPSVVVVDQDDGTLCSETSRRESSPGARLVAEQTEPISTSALVAGAALSGLLAGALEGDMFKRIGFVILLNPGATMSFISFWAVLGIFLASTLVRNVRQLGLVHVKVAYCLAAGYYYAIWRFGDELTYLLGTQASPGAAHHFPVSLWQLFVYTAVYVLPAYFLVSLLLPLVCNRLQRGGKHLGLAFGLNTVCFCLGMIAFTLVAPRLSIFYSLKLFLVLMALAAITLLFISESRPLRRWLTPAFTASVAVAAVATPAAFDRDFFTPSMWPHQLPAQGLRSNAAHTTFFLELPDSRSKLFFGRLSMSGTSQESQEYMRLMAHFPLLAHPHPRKALLICFGVGNTASAIAAHESIQQIDTVDLNENVFATAPAFWAHHGNVHRDSRLRMIVDDGRSFLNVSDETYDLITSEPPPPMAGGVYRLYSREYYEQVLEHLTPDGLMTQWLPEAQMPGDAAELAVRTFVDLFPHSLLLRGSGSHLILVGSPSPIDLDRVADRFDLSEGVAGDLLRIGIWEPSQLVARVIRDDAALRSRIGAGRVLSDQHNDLEHLLYDPDESRRSP